MINRDLALGPGDSVVVMTASGLEVGVFDDHVEVLRHDSTLADDSVLRVERGKGDPLIVCWDRVEIHCAPPERHVLVRAAAATEDEVVQRVALLQSGEVRSAPKGQAVRLLDFGGRTVVAACGGRWLAACDDREAAQKLASRREWVETGC